MYTRVWRYASAADAQAIVLAVGASAVVVKLIDVSMPNINFPNSVWLSTSLLTLVGVSSTRLSIKMYGTRSSRKYITVIGSDRTRILIYGAGSAGSVVAREAQKQRDSGWDVVGFIDDDPQKQRLILNGLRILGTRNDLEAILAQNKVDRVLIAIPSMSRSELRTLVDELNTYHLPILIIPPFTRWAVTGLFSQARPVEVEDLLGRDPLPTDVRKIGGYLNQAVVLVTGAGGSIGAEVCRQVAMMNPQQLVLLGRGENSIFEIHRELKEKYPNLALKFVIGDIRDSRKMSSVFTSVRPDVVFHAAAHKHVPLMEEHPDEAFQNNILGTQSLATLAAAHGTKRFILISSDKAVRPTNVMGASKRIAEMVIQDVASHVEGTTFVGVRFGNVLGSRGSVVRVFREQIANGGPVTVTDERMKRYFMTIPEAVRLVIEAGSIGENGHIYLLDMGEPVRIVDLAERMIRLSGFEPGADIPIKITGIRPGEKLFEELAREGDSVSIDPNERIWSVECPRMMSMDLADAIDNLSALYEAGEQDTLAQAIKQLAWWEPDVSHVGVESTAEDVSFDRVRGATASGILGVTRRGVATGLVSSELGAKA
jgi:FlaA1/EpsC-like NDP-sugar epimerase